MATFKITGEPERLQRQGLRLAAARLGGSLETLTFDGESITVVAAVDEFPRLPPFLTVERVDG